MNKPFFDENDIQTFFDTKQSAEIKSGTEIEPPKIQSQPQPQPKPYIPPSPPPGSQPKIQNSYVGQYTYHRPSPFIPVAKFLGLFILIFSVSFVLFNWQAVLKQFNYYYVTKITQQDFAGNTVAPTATAAPDINVSQLIIPQIQVNAPIIWNIDTDDITDKLESGVVHYKGTALPDEAGNTFITGHSSYFPWAAGNYKDVFALLGKLKVGDKIYIQYRGKNYVFQVSELKVVSPNDLSVLNSTAKKTLSLMTCVPVGTNIQRLVVTANQVL